MLSSKKLLIIFTLILIFSSIIVENCYAIAERIILRDEVDALFEKVEARKREKKEKEFHLDLSLGYGNLFNLSEFSEPDKDNEALHNEYLNYYDEIDMKRSENVFSITLSPRYEIHERISGYLSIPAGLVKVVDYGDPDAIVKWEQTEYFLGLGDIGGGLNIVALVLQRHFFTDNQDEFMYHGFSKGE